jgi:hypothetical protein
MVLKLAGEECGRCGGPLIVDEVDAHDWSHGRAFPANAGDSWCQACDTAACAVCGRRVEGGREFCWSCGPQW